MIKQIKSSYLYFKIRELKYKCHHKILAKIFLLPPKENINSYTSKLIILGDFKKANKILLWAATLFPLPSAELYYRLALTYLILGEEKKGAKWLSVAARKDPFYWQSDFDLPREKVAYIPPRKIGNLNAFLYAGYNSASMLTFNTGQGQLMIDLAKKALESQNKLKKSIKLSKEFNRFIKKNKIILDTTKILPYLWVSQIGHIGMLDIMLRMRKLGWWQGDIILLAPPKEVANNFFLNLVASHYSVFIFQDYDNKDLAADLTYLVKSHGLPYHVFQPPGQPYVRWHEAASLAMLNLSNDEPTWTIAPTFDKQFKENLNLKNSFNKLLLDWGMKKTDWYVCLHIREPGYNGETIHHGASNRNGTLINYISAIEFIVNQGGKVIKMGSENSPPCPSIPGLIDYAHSSTKSDALDIAIVRHAKYFIGTTSGFANVAISLGIPAAQVNCLTTEFQPWTSTVRFCLKHIKRENGVLLSQRELLSELKWALTSMELMKKQGLTMEENSADEILATVQEIHDLTNNRPVKLDPLLVVWRNLLTKKHAYGAAQPSAYYLNKHENTFLK